MVTQLPLPKSHDSGRISPSPWRSKTPAELIPASRVKELLHEIAIVVHTTQVVGTRRANLPKKG